MKKSKTEIEYEKNAREFDKLAKTINMETESVPDGYKKVYYLYDVPVTRDEFYLEPENVDVEKYILREKNAQRRAAFMTKIGPDMLVQKLNPKILDAEGEEYELLAVEIASGVSKKYLKMRNPSVGIFHIEGVGDECLTVADALHWRKPDAMKKITVDNENGADWYQQGDVCIWPKNAKSLKNKPKKLT